MPDAEQNNCGSFLMTDTTQPLVYSFGSAAAGLQFTITAVYNTTTHDTTFTVQVITGALNVNALYWGDGDSTANESRYYQANGSTAWDPNAKADSNLNMNGADVVWN